MSYNRSRKLVWEIFFMSDEKMMTDKEMLELDDSVENDEELKEKVGEIKSLDDIDDSQLED